MRALRTAGLWFLIIFGVIELQVVLVTLAFTLLPRGSSTDIDTSLTVFIEQVKAGNVQSVEVDGREIVYRLIDGETTLATEMEQGDTIEMFAYAPSVPPRK